MVCRIRLFVVLIPLALVLFCVPAFASDMECRMACMQRNYSFGKCSALFTGCDEASGWVWPGQVNACSAKCCCAKGVESLTAEGMCRWLVNKEMGGSSYTCDYADDGEVANYFCEDNKLKLECKDCRPAFLFFGVTCDPPSAYYVGDTVPDGLKCNCTIDTQSGVCQDSEKVPEGSCTDEGGNKYWGYNKPEDGGPLDICDNDNAIDEGEECDGTDLGGKSCYDFGAIGGTLLCPQNCTFDKTQCVMNNGTVSDKCDTSGETKCFGLTLKECRSTNEVLDWVTVEYQSEECCTNGDCSERMCTSKGGVWMPGGQSPDFGMKGYCCGDEGDADLGVQFTNKLCVKDPGYKWIVGEEKGRYVGSRILYCSGAFNICYHDDPYFKIKRSEYCTNLCNMYCDPITGDKWVPDTNPQVLDEPLSQNEKINTQSRNLAGQVGCCPAGWCWNGGVCIENQVDESTNLYVYPHPSTKVPNRCIDGEWKPAKAVFNWDNSMKGYCPNKDTQCLVGNMSYANNNKPRMFFTQSPPQCIKSGQYILDNYCNGTNWISRTSLVATKMLEVGGATLQNNFKLYCDEFKNVLNEYFYTVIGGKRVIEYLGTNCDIGDKKYPCVNNLCVLRNMDTDKVVFGTSMNLALDDPKLGFGDALGIGGCEKSKTNGAFEYTSCGANAIHNPNVSTVIFSDSGVAVTPILTGWGMFIQIIKNPISAISQLLISGELQFFSTSGLPLRFDVLNASRLFSKVYVARFEGGEIVQGVYESSRFDWADNRFKSYLVVKYSGFEEDVCKRVNEYTSGFGRMNCDKSGEDYVVADSKEQPTSLMSRWQDLTSKFKPQP